MKEVYGEQCLARCTIFQCSQRYEAGHVNIKDLPLPGQAHVVTSSATISAVDEHIRQNRPITTRTNAVELSISKGIMHHIIHKKPGYVKVCAQYGPKHLSENQKTARMGVCLTPQFSAVKPSTPFLRAGISVCGCIVCDQCQWRLFI
ncbi:hypothetical protein AVEN_214741-1 [Araneus ventricosus]|uniref:Uncharacterized protein n=1 Tax=Araneus ventricosus TaxID=182803 RepID=A0A4Y2IH62_ARAVE|nr:hypothetical protein AVEN_214741-1 [Araneus ventricosus]